MFSLIVSCPNCSGNANSLMEAVGFSSLRPDEIIIITRREIDIKAYEECSKTKVKVIVPTEDKALSAAAVRNLGASVATAPILMFLQKDYYPDEDYFQEQIAFVKETDSILMGNYRNTEEQSNELFGLIDDYVNFNGRIFTISKANFDRIGGFDETYFGQGVEDVDFGYLAKEKNISIYVHGKFIKDFKTEVYELPLNQFLPIIDNCGLFKQKWKAYPMKAYLQTFKEKGLIDWNGNDEGEINIIKFPSFEMIEDVKVPQSVLQA